MRKHLIYSLMLYFAFSCSKNVEKVLVEPIDYLVSEVRDFDDQIIAKYNYNENKQLIKVEFDDPLSKVSSDLFLEYENGKVRTVRTLDLNSSRFSPNKVFYYLSNGKIDRIIVKGGGPSNEDLEWVLEYSQNSNSISIRANQEEPRTFYNTQDSNVVETINLLRDLRTGEEYEKRSNFKFDKKKRPNFGLDYLVGIDLLPFRGSTSLWERSLSKNNLVQEETNGIKYIMEYNEKDYPVSITIEMDGIETGKPQFFKIIYK